MKDAPLSYLLIQDSNKTENHFINFSDYSWQDCPETGRSIGVYIIFYQGGTIDHGTHVPGPVDHPSTENKYNTAFNAGQDKKIQDVNS